MSNGKQCPSNEFQSLTWARNYCHRHTYNMYLMVILRPCNSSEYSLACLIKLNCTFSQVIVQTPPFARKWGGLSRNGGGGCHIILRFFWRFLMMQHRRKSLCVYLSFVNKNVLQNNCVNKIRDDWHCNSFNSVDSYNSCINYSCK